MAVPGVRLDHPSDRRPLSWSSRSTVHLAIGDAPADRSRFSVSHTF